MKRILLFVATSAFAVVPETRHVGLAAFAGAMARRGTGTLAQTVADVVAMRSVTRDREPPGL